MAAELAIKYSFLTVSSEPDNADLIFEYRVELSDSPLPEPPPPLKLTVDRVEGAKKRGRVRILVPDASDTLGSSTELAQSSDGSIKDAEIRSVPKRTIDSLIWRFFIASQPGGKQTALRVSALTPPAKPVTVTTLATSAVLPKPAPQPAVLPFTAGAFPRLVVGLDLAQSKSFGPIPTAFTAVAADIAPNLQHVLDRLTSSLDPAFEVTLASASAPGATPPTPKVSPSPADAGNTRLQDAERAWGNQLAEMMICTPYGGPNALYGLNDDDLLARTIQSSSASSPTAIYPIVFACQHLASFAVAARGRDLFKPDFSGKRLQLLNAGSMCAATWTSTKIGKWIVTTPDGKDPAESTDGGKGLPGNLTPSEDLETSKLLFAIKDKVASTHPFGSAAVFCYANRPAKQDAECSISNGVEICLLRDGKGGFRMEDVPIFEEREVVLNGVPTKKKVLAKNADGTIKTFKRVARTTWPLHKSAAKKQAGEPLADNTAGAHLAFVLRVDNRLKLFQTLDTGGVNVPKRGEGVEVIPPSNGFHGGIYDDPATDKVNPGKAPTGHDTFRGVGVIEAIDASQATELLDHVKRLKQARPLGLCRLVLLRRGAAITYNNYSRFKEPSQNFLIYASPALPMYDTDPTHNFPISRCLWALRDFPDCARIEAMWFFYVPQGPLGKAMMEASRETRVKDLAEQALTFMKSGINKYRSKQSGLVLTSKILADFTVPVLDVTVEADGKAKLVASYKSKLLNGRGLSLLHGLEGRYGSKSLLPLDSSFLRGGQSDALLPSYFRSV